MSRFKILGHEPAVIVGLVEALLALLLTFGLAGLSQVQAGAILALVSSALGLVVAYATRDTVLSAVTGFAKAGLFLAATYGFALTDAQNAALLSFIAVVGGVLLRQNTESLSTAVSNPSRGATRSQAGRVDLLTALVVLVIVLMVLGIFL